MTLGQRMKEYEHAYQIHFPKRFPVIIRIDGKAFHSYTREMDKPFDEGLQEAMKQTMLYLVENIPGCNFAYQQSDEISLLIPNGDHHFLIPWFNNNLQKIVSVSASFATARFNEIMSRHPKAPGLAHFDSRAYILPKEEVPKYFYWRQADWTRNSINMLARAYFDHEEIKGIPAKKLQDKLFTEKGVNWNDLPVWQKRGVCAVKTVEIFEKEYEGEKIRYSRHRWEIDENIPIFNREWEYIERFLQ